MDPGSRRAKTGSLSGLSITGGMGLGPGGMPPGIGPGVRRQRSLEWRNDRGYSSSEDETLGGRCAPQMDSHVFASLIAQAQQQFNNERRIYRGDDDVATDSTPPAGSPHRQASPFPLESTNARRRHYGAQERLRCGNGDAVYSAPSKKPIMSGLSTLGRGRRHTRAASPNQDSASASDQYDHDSDRNNRICLSNDVRSESPPEPAPPEVPPRGPSLHATAALRGARRGDFAPSALALDVAPAQDLQFMSQGREPHFDS